MPVIKHNPKELFQQYRCYFLGTREPSLTVVCCQLLDPQWKHEIAAMAAT